MDTSKKTFLQVTHFYALGIFLLCQFFSPSSLSDNSYTAKITTPFSVKNLYPPMLRFYEPLPSSALQPYRESLSIELLQSYSSVFQYDALPDGSLLVDMELYNLDLRMRRAFTEETELTLTVPLYYAHDGFMDAFLRDYHSALGLPNSGREYRPDDEFGYFYIDPGGSESWIGKEGWEVGDLAISLRHHLMSDETWSMALLGGITLPTGSTKRGWGTGKPDIAVGGVASWLAKKWFGHIEGHLLHPFAHGSEATDYRDYIRLSTTIGYQLGNRWSVMAQVQGGSSPYDSSLQQLDNAPWLVTLGGRIALSNTSALTLAFTEGITQKTTADFSLSIGLEFNL